MKSPLVVLLCLSAALQLRAVETRERVARSDAAIRPALEFIGHYSPEEVSYYGLEEYDEQVSDLKPGVFERSQADREKLIRVLEDRAADQPDLKIRQDIQIVIQRVRDQFESEKLQHDLLLPYFDVPKDVFAGLHGLLDARNTPERHARAVARLKRYAGVVAGCEPLTLLAEARTRERFATAGLTGPYFEELKKNTDNVERYIAGLSDLFEGAHLSGWQDAHAKLAAQFREYNSWVKSELLPRARKSNRLPDAIYANNLKTFGVRMAPAELMERARFGFLEIRDEMQAIALRIAAEQHLKSGDYRDVIRDLKGKQISGAAVLPFYKERLQQIEQIIREHDIITLPQRISSIRLASDAESSVQPAPHMRPPRLIGNKGEYGEFVLPLTNPTATPGTLQDDFTNDPFAWTLVAHESRPGHELQFASMVEQGIPIARAVFAMNSANVEGWGLYAESIMKQYMPLEGQLFSLQARLQRAARAFLDPMLNLGEMEPARAKDFLMREVCLSDPFATQEVDRYTFRAPGQATSYYYGYLKLREVRTRAELALGKKFKQKAFNDFILNQGLLPPEVLSEAVMSEFVPAQL